jgi:hypothetical protein
LSIISGSQSLGKIVECKAHQEQKLASMGHTKNNSSTAKSIVDNELIERLVVEEEAHHDDHSCHTLVLEADSDEEDWFEPDVPMEMKLQAFLKSINKDKIPLIFR